MTPAELFRRLRLIQAVVHETLRDAQALLGAEPVRRSGRKYTADDRARWRDHAAQPDLAMRSGRAKGRLIARREGLPAAAEESIRRSLK